MIGRTREGPERAEIEAKPAGRKPERLHIEGARGFKENGMPYVQVWVDGAGLSEFEDDDLVKELQQRGFSVAKKPLDAEGMERIEHLIDAGMYQVAKDEALYLIESHLGRHGTLSRAH